MQSRSSSNKNEILELVRENPFITQQELADELEISRSAVANYISNLFEEGLITGRAYVLPQAERIVCIGGANVDRKIQTINPVQYATSTLPKQPRHTEESLKILLRIQAGWMSGTGVYRSFAAKQTSVIDVTGAGDAFVAGVIYFLLRVPENMTGACHVGLKAAALTLESHSTVSPELTPSLMKQWLNNTYE